MEEGRKLCLFDIDGTLTPARLVPKMFPLNTYSQWKIQ